MAITLDAELAVPVYSEVCSSCAHLDTSRERHCAAFPVGIPLAIWLGDNDHTRPYLGEHGIQFEPVRAGARRRVQPAPAAD